MKKKVINFVFSIIVFILLSSTISRASSLQYVGVNVGDRFKYKITNGHILTSFNDTIYLDDSDLNIQGKKVDIEITSIQESLSESFLGFFVEAIMVNVTETVEGEQYQGYTLVDEWYIMFSIILLSYTSVTQFFDPGSYEFHPPEPSATEIEEFLLLPIFATTNTSFYQELVDQGGTSTAPLQPQGGTPSKMVVDQIQTTFDGVSKFTLNATMDDTVSGIINIDIEWSSYAKLEFYVFIDTQKGLVKDYYLNYKNVILIGTNKTINEITYGFEEESSGNTFTLDYYAILPIYICMGISAIFMILKKKRRE